MDIRVKVEEKRTELRTVVEETLVQIREGASVYDAPPSEAKLWIDETARRVVQTLGSNDIIELDVLGTLLLAGFTGWFQKATEGGIFPYQPTAGQDQRLSLVGGPWPSNSLFEEFVYQIIFSPSAGFETEEQVDKLGHFLEVYDQVLGEPFYVLFDNEPAQA